uniref:ubiquitinyl hydrolase 1 n=1 Tax=Macrostomum lignano TaxID=282301 RepID=A0A1I8JS64_9PLAT
QQYSRAQHRFSAVPAAASPVQQYQPKEPSPPPTPAQAGSGLRPPPLKLLIARDDDEVTFNEGDVVTNGDPIDEGWMYGIVERTGQFAPRPEWTPPGRYQLEFGYFDDYSRKRAELFSCPSPNALPVAACRCCVSAPVAAAASAVGENDSGIEEAPAAVTKPETKPAATGWAGLFAAPPAAQKAVVVSLPPTTNSSETSPPATAAWKSQQRPVPPEQDRELAAIGDALRRVAAQLGVALRRRRLYSARNRGPSSTPALDCMVELLSYYSQAANPRKLTSGQPYTPHQAYQLVSAESAAMPSRGTELRAGREEDAEEFLSHLLNSLHDELAKATGDGSSHSNGQANGDKTAQAEADAETDVADEWQCVGPKNRSAVTRTCQSATGTIVSELFGGQLRHTSLSGPTGRPQPIFSPSLSCRWTSTCRIGQAGTLAEALEAPELVETSEGRATKTQLFELPPRLLLLQLKRFHYAEASAGVVKIDRRLDLPETLKLRKAWLSHQARAKPQRLDYCLFAIVYHVGHATSGHYITAVLQPGLN